MEAKRLDGSANWTEYPPLIPAPKVNRSLIPACSLNDARSFPATMELSAFSLLEIKNPPNPKEVAVSFVWRVLIGLP